MSPPSCQPPWLLTLRSDAEWVTQGTVGIGAVWVGLLTVQALAILLASFRVFLGPTLADRIISLDLIAFAASGMIGSYAIASGEPALLDAALILGLVVFLGTVAMARFLEVVESARRRH